MYVASNYSTIYSTSKSAVHFLTPEPSYLREAAARRYRFESLCRQLGSKTGGLKVIVRLLRAATPPLKLLGKAFVAGTIAFKGNTAVYVVPRAGVNLRRGAAGRRWVRGRASFCGIAAVLIWLIVGFAV